MPPANRDAEGWRQQNAAANTMSASQTPPGSTAGTANVPTPEAAGGDPSMEDILASIRRILSEDETPASGANPPASPTGEPAHAPNETHVPNETGGDDVLVLDAAMMVPEPTRAVFDPPPIETAQPSPLPAPIAPRSMDMATSNLVAPEAAAAAASSLGSLMRTLAAERTLRVHSGGPTIEDVVREELRPLLKAWLDINLPPMVERLVRAEIERVVGRAVP
jgi:uncharacterized protein